MDLKCPESESQPSCVTSGKLPHLSEPQYPHLTGLWSGNCERRPPVGVQKTGDSFFVFSAYGVMGLASRDP